MPTLTPEIEKNFHQNIENWKANLLDISKRNRLVNFKYKRNQSVKILDDLDVLHDELISDGSEIIINKLSLDFELKNLTEYDEYQKVMKKLRLERNSVMKEKGINILYLVLGTLKWKASSNSADLEEAPLLLIPIEIKQQNKTSPFRMLAFEDQVEINYTLNFKLKNEFGIELKEFQHSSITKYIKEIQNIFPPEMAAEIHTTAYISLMNFSKIAMYRDLEKYKELIQGHPVVGKISTKQKVYNTDEVQSILTIPPEDTAIQTYQVMDADSSQMEAIMAAKQGTSFVLEGPPGTGKSQTIANIIAECLALNKKVLFVSEKIAALQVVYNRLSTVGLGDYCLELHSNKTNKKAVISDLYSSLIKNKHKKGVNIQDHEAIDIVKKQLNVYVSALHKKNANYNVSAYYLHGLLAQFSDIPTMNVDLSHFATSNKDNITHITQLLEHLDILETPIIKYKNATWHAISSTSWSLAKETQLRDYINSYQELLNQLQMASRQIEQQFQYKINSPAQFKHVLATYTQFKSQKLSLRYDWLQQGNFVLKKTFAKNFFVYESEFQTIKQQLLEQFSDLHFDLASVYEETQQKLSSSMNIDILKEEIITQNDYKILPLFKNTVETFGLYKTILQQFNKHLFDDFSNCSLQQVQQFKELLALLHQGQSVPQIWGEPEEYERIEKTLYNALELGKAMQKMHHTLQPTMHLNKIEQTTINAIAVIEKVQSINPSKLNFYYEFKDTLEVDFATLKQKLPLIEESSNILFTKINLHRELHLPNIEQFLAIITALQQCKTLEESWLTTQNLNMSQRKAKEFFILQEDILSLKERILQTWESDIFDFFEDEPDIYERFRTQYTSFFSKMSGAFKRDKNTLKSMLKNDDSFDLPAITANLKELHRYTKLLDSLKKQTLDFEEAIGQQYEKLDTNKEAVIQNYEKVHFFIELAEQFGLNQQTRKQIISNQKWFETEFYDSLKKLATNVDTVKDLITLYNQKTFTVQTTLNVKEILLLIQREDALASNVIKAINTCNIILKNDSPTVSHFLNTLEDMKTYYAQLETFTQKTPNYEQDYGILFTQIETDWDSLMKTVRWYGDVQVFLEQENFTKEERNKINTFIFNYSHEFLQDISSIFNTAEEKLKNIFSQLNLYMQPNVTISSLYTIHIAKVSTELTDTLAYLEQFIAYVKKLKDSSKIVIPNSEEFKEKWLLIRRLQYLQQEINQQKVDVEQLFGEGYVLQGKTLIEVEAQIDLNEQLSDFTKQQELHISPAFIQLLQHSLLENYIEYIITIRSNEDYFNSILHESFILKNIDYEQEKSVIKNYVSYIYEIEELIRIKNILHNLDKYGLKSFLQKLIENDKYDEYSLKDLFLRRWYEHIIDEMYDNDVTLRDFNKKNFESQIEAFKNLDTKQFQSNVNRVINFLDDNLQTLRLSPTFSSELELLNRENNKKRSHLPIRTLISEIPNLFLTLKPCVMMSPLSVSEFLDPEQLQFDYVIFDEASQICPEDAIAPMIRGKHIIVTGDLKQMPPTKFFSASVSLDASDYDDDTEEIEEIESILGLCTDLLPAKTLRWHYRSKHESLIAFSNKHFYSNSLYTFPSVDIISQDYGVKFDFLENGYFDRGGSRTNIIEAKRVADLVINHYEVSPAISLGVIAFSKDQADEIQRQLEANLREKPHLENLIFSEEREEYFFIKNLENVQGDERDNIILSIAYAKDRNGKLHLNFGPINKSGGERRLNVAITRAKRKLTVVSSMKDTEIDLSRTTSLGAELLKNYLLFARTNELPDLMSINEELHFDSPFEQDVYNSLTQLGYRVVTQVGCSGYRIDLAIIHPKKPGTFLVGIECDGASYHSSKTARDRDRLRQQVLEGLGWKIYRIWSQDWFKNKKHEVERLKEMINHLI